MSVMQPTGRSEFSDEQLRSPMVHVPYVQIVLWGLLSISVLYLQYRLWFAHGSLNSLSEIRYAIGIQAERNNKLLMRNEQLRAEVEELKHVDEVIAERAREQLGLIGHNETFYIVTD
ncbi:MAG: hypothetical protein CME36_19120 [unclassified Hahellaceae]|nr:hypothetical protein [Hahellaceae bacterium]|tara:strand:- start:20968 stop:21318 length:351 start_codon:yes stop_codon:yes gene_type:complete